MIDYIRITTKSPATGFSVKDWCERVLGQIDEYRGEIGKPLMGYTSAYNTTYGVMMHNPDNPQLGIMYQVAGRGLQKMYSDGLTEKDILKQLCLKQVKFTRLDYAIDVLNNPEANVYSFYEYISNVNTGSRETRIIRSRKPREESEGTADTAYLGSRHSDRLLRVYDKARELKMDGMWTRIEVQLNHKRAQQTAYAGKDDILPVAAGEILSMNDWHGLGWFVTAVNTCTPQFIKVPEGEPQPELYFDKTIMPWLRANLPQLRLSQRGELYELAKRHFTGKRNR